eukprot:Gb_20446 [translate_table: standard]
MDSTEAKKKKKKKKKTGGHEEGPSGSISLNGAHEASATVGTKEDDDEEDGQGESGALEGSTDVAKKKKKKSKSKKKKEPLEQTDPPSIPVMDLFPSGDFPEGEIQQYRDE